MCIVWPGLCLGPSTPVIMMESLCLASISSEFPAALGQFTSAVRAGQATSHTIDRERSCCMGQTNIPEVDNYVVLSSLAKIRARKYFLKAEQSIHSHHCSSLIKWTIFKTVVDLRIFLFCEKDSILTILFLYLTQNKLKNIDLLNSNTNMEIILHLLLGIYLKFQSYVVLSSLVATTFLTLWHKSM